MKAQIFGHGISDQTAHEKWPVSKWMRFLSIELFSEAVILFFVSFLIFLIKRTEGVDSFMVSGAFDGTTQLTYFVSVNILSLILALHGYYLFFFNNESEIHDDHLRLFFKTAGMTSIPVFILVVSVTLYFIFG